MEKIGYIKNWILNRIGGVILKKYKFGYQPYLMVLVTTIISLPILFMGKFSVMWYLLCLPLLILEYLNIINILFFCYTSEDDNGITQKTLFSCKVIPWNYLSISINESFFMYKYSISIYGNDKKINITSWTKGSKELIKIILDECKKRDIKVDLMVEKIIED